MSVKYEIVFGDKTRQSASSVGEALEKINKDIGDNPSKFATLRRNLDNEVSLFVGQYRSTEEGYLLCR